MRKKIADGDFRYIISTIISIRAADAKRRMIREKVVHCRKEKFDVYIGRPSKWGNPFTIGKDGTREDVIRKYKKYIITNPDLLNSLYELKGKILGCWCSPKVCHGDVLIELIHAKGE